MATVTNPKNYPVARPPGKEHIPIYPTGFIAIRIVQLVLAVIILGLAAYGLYMLSFDGNQFILAVAVMCIVTSVYQLIAHYGPPAAYNYWAILGLDIFNIIMWLCSFALLASEVAPYFNAGSYSCNVYGRCTRTGLTGVYLTIAATQMAAAGLGGGEFLLYVISLVIHSMRLHRHRAAGLHCMPGSGSTGPTGGAMASVPVVPVIYTTGKPGAQLGYQQPYPVQPQQPIPAYMQYAQAQQQQQAYPYPQQAGYPVAMPMPQQQQQFPQQFPQQQQVPQQQVPQQQTPQQQVPQQQLPQQQFSQQQTPQQQAPQQVPTPQQQQQPYPPPYAAKVAPGQQQPSPSPSQSPAPVLAPQPTGRSLAGQGHGQELPAQ